VKFVRAGFVGLDQRFEFRFVIQLNSKLYAAQNVDFNALPPAGRAAWACQVQPIPAQTWDMIPM